MLASSKFLMPVMAIAAQSSPALADWQYTSWNMNPEQVVSASNGEARLAAPSPRPLKKNFYKAGAVGTHVLGKWQFRSTFYFEQQSNELRNIMLELPSESDGCSVVRSDVEQLYGPPVREVKGIYTFIDWSDDRHGNGVRFLDFGSLCALSYTPLRKGGTISR